MCGTLCVFVVILQGTCFSLSHFFDGCVGCRLVFIMCTCARVCLLVQLAVPVYGAWPLSCVGPSMHLGPEALLCKSSSTPIYTYVLVCFLHGCVCPVISHVPHPHFEVVERVMPRYSLEKCRRKGERSHLFLETSKAEFIHSGAFCFRLVICNRGFLRSSQFHQETSRAEFNLAVRRLIDVLLAPRGNCG